MSTTAELLSGLSDRRKTLADNLVTMGVTAAQTEGFDTLVPKVLTIDQNKSVARGTLTFAEDSKVLTVSGLEFLPKKVFVCSDGVDTSRVSGTLALCTSFYANLYQSDLNLIITLYRYYNSNLMPGAVVKSITDPESCFSTADGTFSLTLDSSYLGSMNGITYFCKGAQYTWTAEG